MAIVNVTMNGHGPFPMMFDTGSVAAVTPETATVLGLTVQSGGTGKPNSAEVCGIVRDGIHRSVALTLKELLP
jgi:hypothetical protein